MPLWAKLLAFGVAMAAAGALTAALVFRSPSPGATSADLPAQAARSLSTPAAAIDGTARGRHELATQAEIVRLRREVEELRQKGQFQSAVVKGMAPTIDPARPLDWPEDLPPEYRPEGFTRVVSELRATCPALAKAEADCAEPPCLLIFTGDGQLCPEYHQVYGNTLSGFTGMTVTCDGGVTHVMSAIAPMTSWEEKDDLDPAYKRATSERLRARLQHYATLCE